MLPGRLTTRSEDETEALGALLSDCASPGISFLLDGPVGAGKTVFARGFVRARLAEYGIVEDVPSPTYNLVQTYLAGNVEIWHVDLYRLNGPGEILDLGLEDAFLSAICLVEWPDRLQWHVPRQHAKLTFEPSSNGSHVEIAIETTSTNLLEMLHSMDLNK